MATKTKLKAKFLGWQETLFDGPISLFNLLVSIPGHSKGSTVSEDTLRKAGIEIPKYPKFKK